MWKLSYGKAFWCYLRLSDKKVYKQGIKVERLMKKINRCECMLKFLYNCRYKDVFPKFVRLRNINNQPLKKKSRYYRRILFDEIDEKIKHLKNLKLQLVKEHALLNGITTWIKNSVLTYRLKMVISKGERNIKTQNKILDGLISHKKEVNGINENPIQ